ncbi:MAG: response regulator transcription factor, partial [Actinomycetia bacterium]|nr:response regulator transcription factor [Actinomycetes bacterium]
MSEPNDEKPSIRWRVVVVDDHAMFRDGVVSALGDAVDVVGQADDIDQAVTTVEETEPDVVLLDVHLPSGSGAEVIETLRHRGSAGSSRYLALSVSDAADDVLALVRAGAQGYVTKRIQPAELIDAIGHVAVGNAVFSPRLAALVLEAFRSSTSESQAPTPPPEDLDRLSVREKEVMRLLARGFTYKEIAAELFISDRTVESHASSVLR